VFADDINLHMAASKNFAMKS